MSDGGRLVPRDSAAYREFSRLYQLARSMRPTGIDRWNGDLYATPGGSWGGFQPKNGDMRVSGPLVLGHLTDPASTPDQRAEALATVLHEATHAGMAIDAPGEPNAVRTKHSLGAIEGFAELRTLTDFEPFAASAGYSELRLTKPQYPGAYAAMDSLADQASGPAKDRLTFIAHGTRGPGVMHFDQLADGVVRNRLAEVVPFREEDRQAVRAALISTMLHPGWQILKDSPRNIGEQVAEDVRRSLNAKVDEIRRHYHFSPRTPFDGGHPNLEAVRSSDSPRQERGEAGAGADVAGGLRFLGGQAAAGGAVARRPVLGQGERRAGTSYSASAGRGAGHGQPERR